jgi:hypothetical protein
MNIFSKKSCQVFPELKWCYLLTLPSNVFVNHLNYIDSFVIQNNSGEILVWSFAGEFPEDTAAYNATYRAWLKYRSFNIMRQFNPGDKVKRPHQNFTGTVSVVESVLSDYGSTQQVGYRYRVLWGDGSETFIYPEEVVLVERFGRPVMNSNPYAVSPDGVDV